VVVAVAFWAIRRHRREEAEFLEEPAIPDPAGPEGPR